ncbi:universal stress protein [Goodfellowiella coeruleoviolacea]|nr:universal stress protein [Goodfellowiella coeruleoviolacea]
MTHPVVVGVDGSAPAVAAALWAAAEAELRQAPLVVLVVNDDPEREDHATSAAHEAADQCRQRSPGVDVVEEVVHGHVVEELLARSARSQLVVLGSRGRGGFASMLLGSVSTSVASHAHCPVVVVRGGGKATGPVVVGVDDSPASDAALEFAFGMAAEHRASLVAVQAWQEAAFGFTFIDTTPLPDWDVVGQRIATHLAEKLAAWHQQYPAVHTLVLDRRSHPVVALTDVAQAARLLVVGHRGRGGFAGMLLGSVAHGVLHHAACPVAVVRAPRQPR